MSKVLGDAVRRLKVVELAEPPKIPANPGCQASPDAPGFFFAADGERFADRSTGRAAGLTEEAAGNKLAVSGIGCTSSGGCSDPRLDLSLDNCQAWSGVPYSGGRFRAGSPARPMRAVRHGICRDLANRPAPTIGTLFFVGAWTC